MRKFFSLLILISTLSGVDVPGNASPLVPTKPSWASAAGEDRYGRWADISIMQVVQRMRWIPPGEFVMGCPAEEAEWAFADATRLGWTAPQKEWYADAPRHTVTLTTGFWIADSSCTQHMWQAVIGSNPSAFKALPALPVENVSWNDVQGFLATASLATGAGLFLPSEAQWEFSCRAGSSRRYWFGDDPEELIQYANVADQDHKAKYNNDPVYPWLAGRDGFTETAPVRSFKPNKWGLYDMTGNVAQFCADWYVSYALTATTNPTGPGTGEYRVYRGSGWLDIAADCRSANRRGLLPDQRIPWVGFRFCAPDTQP